MTIDHNKLKANREGNRKTGLGWKPKDGPSRVRILPPASRFLDNWDQMDYLALKFEVHYFNIEGRKVTEVSRCLSDLKQRCPACSISRAFKDSEDPGLKEMAKKVRSTSNYAFNMLDLNNLQAGIQKWAANFTCWDKIIEVGANPSWGNIVDPANGVDFTVTLTPGNRTKTGRNQYSAVPEPQRTNVMPILEAVEGWRVLLDGLDSVITEPKEASEIIGFLEEMGFPIAGLAQQFGVTPKALSAAPIATPVPSYTPAPVQVPAAVPLAVSVPAAAAPVPIAVPSAPVPVAGAPIPIAVPVPTAGGEPTRPKVAPVATLLSAVGASAVHYDPGPEYKPVVSDFERPAGTPRCFGDYEPKVHRCQPCPAMSDCQMKMLGIPT